MGSIRRRPQRSHRPDALREGFVAHALQSSGIIGELILWNSGEADVTIIRLADERRLVKVYKLETGRDLDDAIGESIEFIGGGEVPAEGFLWDR